MAVWMVKMMISHGMKWGTRQTQTNPDKTHGCPWCVWLGRRNAPSQKWWISTKIWNLALDIIEINGESALVLLKKWLDPFFGLCLGHVYFFVGDIAFANGGIYWGHKLVMWGMGFLHHSPVPMMKKCQQKMGVLTISGHTQIWFFWWFPKLWLPKIDGLSWNIENKMDDLGGTRMT